MTFPNHNREESKQCHLLLSGGTRQPGIVETGSDSGEDHQGFVTESQAPPDTRRAGLRELMDLVNAWKASMFYTATFSPLLSWPTISPTLTLLASRNLDINYTSQP